MSGFFITFEGGEGVGKSTQTEALRCLLVARGHDVVITREPGGAAGAEQIRALLTGGDVDAWDDLEECLLMNAARALHIRKVIKPALERGKIVLCDRFIDSTRAYQAGAGMMPLKEVRVIERVVARHSLPDLTIVLDLEIETGLLRAADRGKADRFERKGMKYHAAVRRTFRQIAQQEPDRCALIAAGGPAEDVTRRISDIVMARLDLWADHKGRCGGHDAGDLP